MRWYNKESDGTATKSELMTSGGPPNDEMLFEYQFWERFIVHHCTTEYSWIPLIRKLVIRITNCPDRLGPSGKFVENSTKLTRLEITGNRIKYSTVLWLLELRISHGRMVYTQVHTVNSDSELKTANVAY